MKHDQFSITAAFLIHVFLVLVFSGCADTREMTYRDIRGYLDQIRVINAHEHQHLPGEYGDHEFGFYHLLATTYLSSDIRSAGTSFGDMDELNSLNLDEMWDRYGDGLDHARNTSYYNHFVKGLERLYGFRDLYFTRDNIAVLDEKIRQNYANYGDWFDTAFKDAGFDLMFYDQYWNPFNSEMEVLILARSMFILPSVHTSSGKTWKTRWFVSKIQWLTAVPSITRMCLMKRPMHFFPGHHPRFRLRKPKNSRISCSTG